MKKLALTLMAMAALLTLSGPIKSVAAPAMSSVTASATAAEKVGAAWKQMSEDVWKGALVLTLEEDGETVRSENYRALTEGQRVLYRALEVACARDEDAVLLLGADTRHEVWEDSSAVLTCFLSDHPEEMRLRQVHGRGIRGAWVRLEMDYDESVTEAQEADAIWAAECLARSLEGLDPRTQVTELYRVLTGTVTYNKAERAHHTMWAALVEKEACCEGVAETMAWELTRLGLENRVIKARVAGVGHAWNAVKLDGVWYELDATWDLGKGEGAWRWFLREEAHPDAQPL